MLCVLGDFVVAVNDSPHMLYLLLLCIGRYGLDSEGVSAIDGLFEVVDLVAHGQFGLQFYHPFP